MVAMHWTEVAGIRVPVRIGGHPALDFVNTWAGWDEPPRPDHEWLSSYEHFAVWSMHADLLATGELDRVRGTARRNPGYAAEVLTAARRLRTALHTAALDPRDERAVATVTGFVRQAGAVVRLQPGTEPAWQFAGPARLDTPLHAVSWAAADLLTRAPLERVRACPGDVCGWLFLDRTGRRRWCSMSSCGNRAKVRAHAERQRQAR
jgi:predicted RNA-binding Zn ribbon-like protein